jgi:hypothetical protein
MTIGGNPSQDNCFLTEGLSFQLHQNRGREGGVGGVFYHHLMNAVDGGLIQLDPYAPGIPILPFPLAGNHAHHGKGIIQRVIGKNRAARGPLKRQGPMFKLIAFAWGLGIAIG